MEKPIESIRAALRYGPDHPDPNKTESLRFGLLEIRVSGPCRDAAGCFVVAQVESYVKDTGMTGPMGDGQTEVERESVATRCSGVCLHIQPVGACV